MSNATRQKGLRGEQRAAKVYRDAGWEVRRLDGLGDFIARSPRDVFAHNEVKNQRRLQLPIWLRQAKAETYAGYVPVVVFPDASGELWACLPLERLARMGG